MLEKLAYKDGKEEAIVEEQWMAPIITYIYPVPCASGTSLAGETRKIHIHTITPSTRYYGTTSPFGRTESLICDMLVVCDLPQPKLPKHSNLQQFARPMGSRRLMMSTMPATSEGQSL